VAVVGAIVLYILVSVFARGSERESRWKILCIAIGTPLLGAAAAIATSEVVSSIPAGAGLALVVEVVALLAALIYWCEIDRRSAGKIAASYFGIAIVLSIVWAMFAGPAA